MFFQPIFSLLLVLLVLGSSCAPSYTSFDHEGTSRDYLIHIPEGLPANRPLLLVLHGYTMKAHEMQAYAMFDPLADQHQFAVCYPQGTPDEQGIPHWNADLSISETDDVGFLLSLTRYLQTTYQFDPARTFVCGLSNGGFMTYTLACKTSEVFRAGASVVGTISGQSWASCNPETAMPMLQISSETDEIVPIDGSMASDGGWGGAPEMDSVMRYWVKVNQCSSTDTLHLSDKTTAYVSKNDSTGQEVWYYRSSSFGHEWPNVLFNESAELNASEKIWEFFDKY